MQRNECVLYFDERFHHRLRCIVAEVPACHTILQTVIPVEIAADPLAQPIGGGWVDVPDTWQSERHRFTIGHAEQRTNGGPNDDGRVMKLINRQTRESAGEGVIDFIPMANESIAGGVML